MRAIVAALPPQPCYVGSSRNCVRSRAWAARAEGCAYRVDRAYVVLRGGATADLPRAPPGAPPALPTFRPADPARAVSTRAAASALDRRARGAAEVALQYSLCNEPWLKYSPAAAADRGLKRGGWTSARLESRVLLLETKTDRFELSRAAPADATAGVGAADTYRWARVKRPLPLRRMRAVGLPLPEEEVEIVHPALPWEAVAWGPAAVTVAGASVPVVRIHFADCVPPGGGEDDEEDDEEG